jgi:hypothetical protein
MARRYRAGAVSAPRRFSGRTRYVTTLLLRVRAPCGQLIPPETPIVAGHTPRRKFQMDTRTIAILALVIAVIIVLILVL